MNPTSAVPLLVTPAVLPAGLLAWTAPTVAQPVRFVAFGDMPYCQPEALDHCSAEEARVVQLGQAINAAGPAFSVFLGDTNRGSELCTDEKLLCLHLDGPIDALHCVIAARRAYVSKDGCKGGRESC